MSENQPEPISLIISESEMMMIEAALRNYLMGLTESSFSYTEELLGSYEVLHQKIEDTLTTAKKRRNNEQLD